MNHDQMKCHICSNYLHGIDRCKYCSFEYDDTLPWTNDEWDILDMDDDAEWSHLQIMYRLKAKGIECLYADIWYKNNLAIIVGAKADSETVAMALGVNPEVVYDAGDLPLLIINLFQEKCLRAYTPYHDEDGVHLNFVELLGVFNEFGVFNDG